MQHIYAEKHVRWVYVISKQHISLITEPTPTLPPHHTLQIQTSMFLVFPYAFSFASLSQEKPKHKQTKLTISHILIYFLSHHARIQPKHILLSPSPPNADYYKYLALGRNSFSLRTATNRQTRNHKAALRVWKTKISANHTQHTFIAIAPHYTPSSMLRWCIFPDHQFVALINALCSSVPRSVCVTLKTLFGFRQAVAYHTRTSGLCEFCYRREVIFVFYTPKHVDYMNRRCDMLRRAWEQEAKPSETTEPR